MDEIEQELIPGLPDDIALDCLARVPHQFHPGLRPVCHRWRDLVTAPSFRRRRLSTGAAEDLVFMVQALLPETTENVVSTGVHADATGEVKEDNKSNTAAANCHPPTYSLSLYNATLGSWQRLAAASAVPMFAQCAVVDDKLVLVGGWDPVTFDPVADVRVLDLGTGEWRPGAPMAAARSFFACAAAEGKFYVAGGHDGLKNALRSAEAYDVATDAWTTLPAMAEERDECHGVVAGGRFWAVSGYGTERQGMFDTSAECYDPATGVWTKEEGFIAGSGGGAAPATAFVGVDERIWSVDCGRKEVREYSGREWRSVAALPEGRRGEGARDGGGGERRGLRSVIAGRGEQAVVCGGNAAGVFWVHVFCSRYPNITVYRTVGNKVTTPFAFFSELTTAATTVLFLLIDFWGLSSYIPPLDAGLHM